MRKIPADAVAGSRIVGRRKAKLAANGDLECLIIFPVYQSFSASLLG
jgi:hypothetical protein